MVVSRNFTGGFFCHCFQSKILEGAARIGVCLKFSFFWSNYTTESWITGSCAIIISSTAQVLFSTIQIIQVSKFNNNKECIRFVVLREIFSVSYSSFYNKDNSYDRRKFK